MPVVLFNQFKYFFNLFFLMIALSQIIPALRVGFLISFVAPLVFVLAVTMVKEWYDDSQRAQKDLAVNEASYLTLDFEGGVFKPMQSQHLKVGDYVVLHPNERAPADLVLLWTSDPSGSLFIRTDQLDGETDWKVRRPMTSTQTSLGTPGPDEHWLQPLYKFQDQRGAVIYSEEPSKLIYEYLGLYEREDPVTKNVAKEPLSLENTMWANTVLASQH